MALSHAQAAAIAVNRFGLGARPDDALPADPQGWLADQIGRFQPAPPLLAGLPQAEGFVHDYRVQLASLPKGTPDPMARENARLAARRAKQAMRGTLDTDAASGLAATPLAPSRLDAKAVFSAQAHDRYRAAVNARLAVALTTPTPFMERIAAFWSNHFALSDDTTTMIAYSGDYERDAIRPHVAGRFADLLLAAETHPAMLTYLDQSRSIGPNSSLARHAAARPDGKAKGLNENLAREIMELHTLGVRTGYTQADVTELARALTGLSVAGDGAGKQADPVDAAGTTFRPALHEPGARTIMGKTYPPGGVEQARAILLDLAASPATARHIATKLARHFVADDPPPALVDRLSAVFVKSDGDLPTVYRALIAAPEAWMPGAPKFKTPWDWSVSALRGLGWRDLGRLDAAPMLTQLGQTVWKPGQPIGYDDIAASWAAPDALMRRVELAQRLAGTADDTLDARALAPRLLPGTLTAATIAALTQAESGQTALALLLVSPEFQRR